MIDVFREFEVESFNFPGQVHRWHLSRLLQKGTHNIHDTLLQVIFKTCYFVLKKSSFKLMCINFIIIFFLTFVIKNLNKFNF